MRCSILPVDPCGLAGEVLPVPEVRFIGYHIAVMYRNGRSTGSNRIWTGRYHPG